MRRRDFIARGSLAVSRLAAGGLLVVGGAPAAKVLDDGAGFHALELPLFPLPSVAFPDELVLLHIYEARYRDLIEDCARTETPFGITTTFDGQMSGFGTEMKLERILGESDSGELDIAVRGQGAFRLQTFWPRLHHKSYPGGVIEPLPNDSQTEPEVQTTVVRLYNRLHQLLGTGQSLTGPPPANLSFALGHDVTLSVVGELALLAMTHEAERQRYLVRHLERALGRLETLDSARAPGPGRMDSGVR